MERLIRIPCTKASAHYFANQKAEQTRIEKCVNAMTDGYTLADLEIAERHVAEGQRHVVEQEELVSRLRLKKLPTEDAENLLSSFRSLLQMHKEHRDAIEAQVRAQQV